MKRFACIIVVVLAISLCGVATAVSLDSRIVNNIRGANTSQELSRVAEQIVRSEASLRPNDFQEGTQIAAETSAYLLFIQIKQNALVLEKMTDGGAPATEAPQE